MKRLRTMGTFVTICVLVVGIGIAGALANSTDSHDTGCMVRWASGTDMYVTWNPFDNDPHLDSYSDSWNTWSNSAAPINTISVSSKVYNNGAKIYDSTNTQYGSPRVTRNWVNDRLPSGSYTGSSDHYYKAYFFGSSNPTEYRVTTSDYP